MKKNRKSVIFAVILLLCALFAVGFIWWNSLRTGPESTGVSDHIVHLVKVLFPDYFKEQGYYKISHFVRKSGHFIEFYMLGIIASLLIGRFSARMQKKTTPKRAAIRILLLSALCCFLTASLDEGIQLFVSGRSGQFTDVLLDTAGGTLACLTVFLISLIRICRREKQRRPRL